jgi:hypothetical protein
VISTDQAKVDGFVLVALMVQVAPPLGVAVLFHFGILLPPGPGIVTNVDRYTQLFAPILYRKLAWL